MPSREEVLALVARIDKLVAEIDAYLEASRQRPEPYGDAWWALQGEEMRRAVRSPEFKAAERANEARRERKRNEPKQGGI